MIRRPVCSRPVKAILSRPSWSSMACPVTAPVPLTMLSAPAGSPARSAMRASIIAEWGANSEGLKTTQLPQARAGAILMAALRNGKFHGTMAPITPTGSRS